MDLPRMIADATQLSTRNVLLISVVVLVGIRLLSCLLQHGSAHTLPGPFSWPIIGNAAQLGHAPHIYFSQMARKYGEVFQIRLGSKPVVVLNGDAIRQALITKGADFAGRPDFQSFKFVSAGRSMAFGNYSEHWKMHRKVTQTTLRTLTTRNIHTKQTFENHIVSEVQELINIFLRETQKTKHFQPNHYLVVSIANIMSALCFGNRYSYDDLEFQQMVGRNDRFTKTVGAGSIVDVMPWLQYFPNPIKTLYGQFKELNDEFYEFMRVKVVEHRKTIESSFIRDMTDAFIVALERGLGGSPGVFLDKEYVTPTIVDIFGASQDTLSTALQWLLLVLVRYPDVQKRLQDEVDKVVGRSRLPTIQDQPRLPYVMALIYEVMRFTSFIPLTIPHCTTTNTSINGKLVAKGTVVFINQWSMNHDPKKWDQPEIFNPLRFLDEDGALNKDLTSSVLIFSTGKRRCIGEELSKMLLFLFTTFMAHQCDFTVEKPPPMDYLYGLTLKPSYFQVAVTLREKSQCVSQEVQ
ncbi:cytochrome P450 1B1 [Brachyhypopomus gauderio]|uniref:cytochrome P450 1B1 n=1 Tax=Brachyhypopomus gauderio TaxID=698409 RepID=UPI004042310D